MPTRTPVENLFDLIARVLADGYMSGVMQSRLEDAFNDAVDARVKEARRQSARD